jgi:hypothetical protein
MQCFAVIRLGKDSVPSIKRIDALHGPPDEPLALSVTCKQVPTEAIRGVYAFFWLGSDNNKGGGTSWIQGIRAFGTITDKSGGPKRDDEWNVDVSIEVVLSNSITRKELLRKAPTAYYWCCNVPVIGIEAYSNQTVQLIKIDEPTQDVRALMYALEAVSPGFKAQVETAYPEIFGLFNYAPPSPESRSSGPLLDLLTNAEKQDGSTADVPTYLPANWIISLASKGFLLVSGPSGTGKTRIARDIARTLDYSLEVEYAATAVACRPATCMGFIAVGSDWTDNTPLIGFRNFFGPQRSLVGSNGNEVITNECWYPPVALRLMLRAAAHPDQPHFLILDEMNLSHVERYFGHFLSIIEANRGLAQQGKMPLVDAEGLRLIAVTLRHEGQHPLEAKIAEDLAAVGQGLSVPDNLFIIGTVNVDETTYMFSPKVLDRAHVLEMAVPDPSACLHGYANERPEEMLPCEQAFQILVSAAQRRRNGFWEREAPIRVLAEMGSIELWNALVSEITNAVEKVLNGLQELLTPIGFSFAYRAVNEVCTYLAIYLEVQNPTLFASETASGWQGALDRAVFQKILPKIHGNRRQLGSSLNALSDFFLGKNASYTIGTKVFSLSQKNVLGFELPLSSRKVQSMQMKLEATGYTTFVE